MSDKANAEVAQDLKSVHIAKQKMEDVKCDLERKLQTARNDLGASDKANAELSQEVKSVLSLQQKLTDVKRDLETKLQSVCDDLAASDKANSQLAQEAESMHIAQQKMEDVKRDLETKLQTVWLLAARSQVLEPDADTCAAGTQAYAVDSVRSSSSVRKQLIEAKPTTHRCDELKSETQSEDASTESAVESEYEIDAQVYVN